MALFEQQNQAYILDLLTQLYHNYNIVYIMIELLDIIYQYYSTIFIIS